MPTPLFVCYYCSFFVLTRHVFVDICKSYLQRADRCNQYDGYKRTQALGENIKLHKRLRSKRAGAGTMLRNFGDDVTTVVIARSPAKIARCNNSASSLFTRSRYVKSSLIFDDRGSPFRKCFRYRCLLWKACPMDRGTEVGFRVPDGPKRLAKNRSLAFHHDFQY